ncbi:MAG: FAD-binding protein [Burkholderiaceae bacterium]|nr:MAG: FAD-binding protein [Burkholderiaceae bacterium]
MKKKVAIVGGGWAGLTCAVELIDAGHDVQLFEAAPSLGGRARQVDWTRDGTTVHIDNGQHILLGAYRDTLEVMTRVGVDVTHALRRLPLTLHTPQGLHLRLPPLPAPLHLAWGLLTARGLSWSEKKAALRMVRALREWNWQLLADTTVTQLLRLHEQPGALNHALWHPLCIAALNTPPDEASAQVFVNVLHDSLGGARHDSDLLLPATDLSSLFPQAAASYLMQGGGEIFLATRITDIGITKGGYLLQSAQQRWFAEAVVLALPPWRLLETLAGLATEIAALAPLLQQLTQFGQQSITTCYLQYADHIELPLPICGLHENAERHHYGQWVFDRDTLCGQTGLLAVVISTDGPHLELDNLALADLLDKQLREYFSPLPKLLSSKVICEKRATHACTPGLQKPDLQTGLPGLYLAGDWLDADYPGTLEAAVRSGLAIGRLDHGI